MKIPFVDLYQQYQGLKSELDGVIAEVIENSDFIRGKHMVPFEKEFAAAVGARHCISCANGMKKLHKVITQSMTAGIQKFCSTNRGFLFIRI